MKKHDAYLLKLKDKHNDRITCIGIYTHSSIAIAHYCHTCKRPWMAVPTNLVCKKASGCRLCAEDRINKIKRTPEQYEKEIRTIHNGKIKACEPYKSSHENLLHSCMVCTHTWSPRPNNILGGTGCPACSRTVRREALIKTNDDYILELESVHFDTIIPLERYTLSKTPTRHQCMTCTYIWKPRPDQLLYGRGCPQCRQSQGEKLIGNILRKLDINYDVQKTFDDLRHINKLHFDFYIPSLNLLIEYDGEQHFHPVVYFNGESGFRDTQTRDKVKNKYAKDNGIRLIRIPYTLKREDIKKELVHYLTTDLHKVTV